MVEVQEALTLVGTKSGSIIDLRPSEVKRMHRNKSGDQFDWPDQWIINSELRSRPVDLASHNWARSLAGSHQRRASSTCFVAFV